MFDEMQRHDTAQHTRKSEYFIELQALQVTALNL